MSMAVLKYSFVYGREHLNFIYLSLVTKYYSFDFFFSTIWSKVNIRMAFIPFLARGLYKNRQQITFGLWAIVCQPLIKIVDQKFLMLFQSIQENQNDPGAFILATHFQVGLFKNSWKL